MEHVGTFELTSGNAIFTDPCYDFGEEAEVRTGLWHAYKNEGDFGAFGERVSHLVLVHEDESASADRFLNTLQGRTTVGVTGVDSGQAGMFERDTYGTDEGIDIDTVDQRFVHHGLFYAACCTVTVSKDRAGVIPHGAVSTAGYGDGAYPIYGYEGDDGRLFAAVIEFIGDDEE